MAERPPDLDENGQITSVRHPDLPATSESASSSTNGSLSTALAAHLIPVIKTAVEEFATNPNVMKGAATTGRIIGGISAPIVGGATMGPAGVAMGLRDMSKAAWAGGKTGWFTGKMAQDISTAVANALEKAQPYATGLSTLAGVQSGLNLAQLDDPKRQDIGVLGMGWKAKFEPKMMMVDGKPTLVVPNEDASKLLDSNGNDLSGRKITAMPGSR